MSMRRVKVYQLNSNGQWDDKGTGHVFLRHADDGDTLIISVQSEESGEELLEHKVESSVEYQRQGETIITWCELSTNVDLALSFQEVLNCNEVWEHVSVAQAKAGELPTSPGDDNRPLTSDEEAEGHWVLPKVPDLSNLAEILQKVQSTSNFEKDRVASALTKEGYMRKLLDLFRTAEEQRKLDACHNFFNLFKVIFLLNDVGIFEVVFGEELVMDMIAALEYDPDHPPGSTFRRHRDFLKKAKFKNVMGLDDEEILSRIHQNYRISYVKDVILLRYLDDPTLGTLSSIVFFNNVQLVSRFTHEKPDLMRKLFVHLKTLAPLAQLPHASRASAGSEAQPEEEDDEDDELERLQRQREKDKEKVAGSAKKGAEPPIEKTFENRKDCFLFLQELVNIAKSLQVPTRDAFFKLLIELGLWTAIEDGMVSSSPKDQLWLWLACIEVITGVIVHNAGYFRTFVASRLNVSNSLLSRLFTVISSEEIGSGLAHHLNQLMRMVLDQESMGPDIMDALLDNIYTQQLPKFVAAITTASPGPDVVTDFDGHSAKYHSMELMGYCAQQHGVRMKKFDQKHDVLRKVSSIVPQSSAGMQLVCSAIRFLRIVVGLKDEYYNQRIVQEGLLDPIIDAFVKNGARYNLLNSAVIEMINFIKEQNIKVLVNYLIGKHEAKFQGVKYVETFRLLKLKWEQNQEHLDDSEPVSDTEEKAPSRSGSNNAWKRGRIDEFDSSSEYAYFSDDNDEGAEEKSKENDSEEEEKRFVEETNKLKRMKSGDDDIDFTALKRQKPAPKAKGAPAQSALRLGGGGRGMGNGPSSPGKQQALKVSLNLHNKRSSSPPLSPPSPPLSPPSSPPAAALSPTGKDDHSPLKKRRLSGTLDTFGQS